MAKKKQESDDIFFDNNVEEGCIINISFKSWDDIPVDEDGKMVGLCAGPVNESLYHHGWMNLEHNMSLFLNGAEEVEVADHGTGETALRRIKIRDPHTSGLAVIWIDPRCVESIEVTGDVNHVNLDSCDYEICLKPDILEVECQKITREDAELLFIELGEWLGYEIS